MRGNRSPTATPISAVAAARSRSATRMSGRRRNSSSGVPMSCATGSVGQRLRARRAAATELSGDWPVNTPSRSMLRVTAASRSGIVASVAESCACARELSSCVPRPASRRAVVMRSVSPWLSALRCATARLLLRAAQLEVVARDFGGHADLRRVHARFGRLHFGRARFDLAPHAAEEIQLPERIEAELVEVLVAVRIRRRRELSIAAPASLV